MSTSAVQTAREALGLTFTYVDAFQVKAERLIQQSMTDAAFDALIDVNFGKTQAEANERVRESERRRRSRLHWLFADADTQASIRDTAWAGYQAVAEYRSRGPRHEGRIRRREEVAISASPHRSPYERATGPDLAIPGSLTHAQQFGDAAANIRFKPAHLAWEAADGRADLALDPTGALWQRFTDVPTA